MPSAKVNEMYEKLIEIYRTKGHRNPGLSLNYAIRQLTGTGKSREEAISTLLEKELEQINLGKEAKAMAELRIKQLETELEELRTSVRNRADEVESIKKYLAYTHRSTTGQGIARSIFYVVGAALAVLSFFQYQAYTVYVVAASGFEWVLVLESFVTLSLGAAIIGLGWVLESMARSQPVF